MKLTLMQSTLIVPSYVAQAPELRVRAPRIARVSRRRFFATAKAAAGALLLPATLAQSGCDNPAVQEAAIKIVARLLDLALDALTYYVNQNIQGKLTVENQSAMPTRGNVALELLHSESLDVEDAGETDEYDVPAFTAHTYAFSGFPTSNPDIYRIRAASADDELLSDSFEVAI